MNYQLMPYFAAIRRAFASSPSKRRAWTRRLGLEACGLSGAAACAFGVSVVETGGSGWAVSVAAGASLAARTRPLLSPAWAEAEASNRADAKISLRM
jgi:hypothetical protein